MSDAAPGGAAHFGSCCRELKEALAGEGFDPLVTVSDTGVLYLTVGLVDSEDAGAVGVGDGVDGEGGSALVDHPMFFCPFCGAKLQTAEDVKEKLAGKPTR